MKNKKYNYLAVIQNHTCYGWEDVSEYETDSKFCPIEKNDKPNPKTGRPESLLSHDLREYRASNTGAYRVINRREKISVSTI
jgi:hypothetical protein